MKHLTMTPEQSKEAREALLAFCAEVTALLCYQPEIPFQHKEDLGAALARLHKAIPKE